MNHESAIRMIEGCIRTIPDYPKPGIMFRDITPVLQNKEAFAACIDLLMDRLRDIKVDYIVGIEARGFIIGSALAYGLGVGFIPARKEGKLPYKSIGVDYSLEYGRAKLEMHEDSLKRGDRVLIIDDLLATGGTASAVGKLVEKLGANVEGYAFVIELPDLNGRDKLKSSKIISLVKFVGE